MSNYRSVLLMALLGYVLTLQVMCAYASGREGEAYVGAVSWIVAIVLIAFVTIVFGAGILSAHRARQKGESIPKGIARGLLKGIVIFVGVAAVSVVGLTVLGILWIAYSFLDVYVLNSS